jgi:hypothetical protein
MNGGWRLYRPAIWLAMLGVALALLISPPWLGALVLGVAIGLAVRIDVARRRGVALRRRGSSPRPRG